MQLSGVDGEFEVVIFSEMLSEARERLEAGRPLLVTCEARADGEGVRLSASDIEDLDAAVARAGAGLKVHIDRADAFTALKQAIDTGESGRGQVRLILDIDDLQSVEVALPGGYAVSADMRAAISAVTGVVELRDI